MCADCVRLLSAFRHTTHTQRRHDMRRSATIFSRREGRDKTWWARLNYVDEGWIIRSPFNSGAPLISTANSRTTSATNATTRPATTPATRATARRRRLFAASAVKLRRPRREDHLALPQRDDAKWGASTVESLLAHHAALCWLRLAVMEVRYSCVVNANNTLRQIEHTERRLTEAIHTRV